MWEKRDRDRIAAVKALFALEKQENKMCKIAVIYCIIWIYKQKNPPKNFKT